MMNCDCREGQVWRIRLNSKSNDNELIGLVVEDGIEATLLVLFSVGMFGTRRAGTLSRDRMTSLAWWCWERVS